MAGLVVLMSGCLNNDECDSCVEVTGKLILVENADGDNLVFGDSVIFPFDSIRLTTDEGVEVNLIRNTSIDAIGFGLLDSHDRLILSLDDQTTDTIDFGLIKRQAQFCCEDVTITSETLLNGMVISNSDTLRLVK
ncbi:MAG: hypothetical protein AAFX87_24700 [Bacteroidota bacterium]